MTMKLPQFELYEEGSQIRKSSKAVAANIVEGFGRKRYQQEYLRFLTIAHASCDETVEHLALLEETGSLKDKEISKRLNEGYDKLGRKLARFIETILRSEANIEARSSQRVARKARGV
jgi:four helix bundle protein